jgi:uncharacterized membrane protein
MKLQHCLIAAAALLAISSAAQTPLACTPSHYKLVPLPFHPARINASGTITGTTEDDKPIIWTEKGGAREIELPSGFTSGDPLGIDGSGDVVGAVKREGSDQPVAFEFSRAKFSLLSDKRSKAMAINNSGDVAGQAAEQLILWRKQKLLPLGGCCGGEAHGINDRRQTIGQVNDKEGHYNAFLWDAVHGLRSIAPPQSTMSTALAINLAGHVLVQSLTPPAVFLLRNGHFTPVQLSPEAASQPLALNNCDVIVGEFGAASDFYHAFIWDAKRGFRDLNQLIDSSAGWTLEKAVDINDRGEIIGLGDHGNEEDAGFLLVPEIGFNVSKVQSSKAKP